MSLTIVQMLRLIDSAKNSIAEAKNGLPYEHPLHHEFASAKNALDSLWEHTNEANHIYHMRIEDH